MPVTDFECQIARGQIGRYLDGGALSPQALTSLEEHLAECPGCKAAVAERRAKLLGTLGMPTQAVVSMPVENPLVAALRARAEAEPASPKPTAPSEPAVKASPRYAKAAPAEKGLGKPLALAALLAVVLLGMGRLSHTATAPAAKASTAFAAESLPDPSSPPANVKNAKARPDTLKKSGQAPNVKRSLSDGKGGESPSAGPAAAVPAPEPTTEKTAAKAPHPATKTASTLGDLFQAGPKTNPDAREVAKSASKPRAAEGRAPKRKPVVAKPKVRMVRPKPVRARIRSVVRHAAKAARRVKAVRRAPRTTVRVYGLDGRLLKP